LIASPTAARILDAVSWHVGWMGQIVVEAGGSVGRGSTDRIRSYAPATGALVGEVAVTPADEVRRAVARARRAQQAWAVLPIEERAQRLLRLRDALAEHADELVDILALECGKPRHEALVHEVTTLLDLAAWAAARAPAALAPESMKLHLMKHRTGEVHHVPRGVIGVISPWNFPLVIPMGTVIEGLVTGNACVVKPSEVTPLVLQKAKEIYDSTGLPEDLFGVVFGFAPTGQALIEAGIDHCVFTGAVETGRKVAAACGARLIPCTMELGGKAPLVACEDCDIERTARAIVFGGFANSGQVCISVERVYAHERVYAALVDRVAALTADLRQGDPSRDYVDLGAITLPRQIEIVERHIEDATKKGARVVRGGKRLPGPGQFFEATVLADCNQSMSVMREEIFGPVVPLMSVKSEDEAVALANDSSLGLNAYVFTRKRATARRLAERIQAGSVLVNDVLTNYCTAEAPFGGIKQSGFGRVHGDQALRDLCQPKYVSFDRVPPPSRDPIWFPYTSKSYAWLQRGVRLVFGGGTLAKRIGDLF
jgi:succinate-semialdehyde dehydrogenase/glutarate-semialdehyde dehydrogenase